ncbi:MAG: hypothetical protein JKY71_10700 [Alphaproteobacteria bacterium]|nr:hypothetical protein [Alphaproteobacteria bacterium]
MTKKSTKRSQKAPQDISVHVAFQHINSGVNKLVAARTLVTKDHQSGGFGGYANGPPMRGLNHTTTKAIDLKVKPKDRQSQFEARMQAVRGFLKKIRPEDRLYLATDDADFLAIVHDSSPEAAKAAKEWRKFSKDLNIEIVDLTGQFGESGNHLEDEELSDMDLTRRYAAFRVNKITKPEGGTKGYVNSPSR